MHPLHPTSLGGMIQRITRHLGEEIETRLTPYDMTTQQFAVMMTVLETEGVSQSEIGKRFGMPAYAISRAIDHLEAAGYLERCPHPTSRRAHTIHATQQGRSMGPALFAIAQDVNETFAQPLTARERAQFSYLLMKLLDGLAAKTRPSDQTRLNMGLSVTDENDE